MLLCLSRFGTCTAAMTYAGSLPHLLADWEMSAAEAGTVQAAHNLAYAVSLLASSWLADRVGARRVFVAAAWASAVAFAAFAAWARSYDSALLLFPLVAAALGGTYTPAIMLVAEAVPPSRRGAALGWILAAASAGYIASLLLASGGGALLGYRWAFAASAAGPILGAVAGTWALAGHPAPARPRSGAGTASPGLFAALASRSSVLLTLGYTAHCWELLGMWAWTPAFLTAALSERTAAGPVALGLTIALGIHLSGLAATLVMGAASDRFGRRGVLVGAAAAGAAVSFGFGWSFAAAPWALFALTCAYGFATLGDSGVLSAAMTEAVPPERLGTLLALRSILGFGAGAISPVVFGYVLDATNPAGGLPQTWGWAFATLGVGGAIATACAVLLPKPPAVTR